VKKCILLIGPFPLPVGGVSVHLRRLKYRLRNEFVISCIDESPVIKEDVLNVRTLNLVAYFRQLASADLVHVHSSVPLLRFVHAALARVFLKKLVITLHSYRKQRLINRIFNFFSLRLANELIAVSDFVARDAGRVCKVIPAYISPAPEEMVLEPSWHELVCRCRAQARKIVVSNAYRLDDFHGADLYGFDQIIGVFKNKHVTDNWIAILNVSSLEGCSEKYARFQKEIADAGLTESIYLRNEKLSFCALLPYADAYVRATLTDGDALSIREALSLNVRTIASDAAQRPVGVICYPTGDVGMLTKALLDEVSDTREASVHSFEEDVIGLYKGML